MQIETDRLLLREFKASDWKSVHEYAQDPEVAQFMTWGPNTEKDTLNFIDTRLQLMREKPRKAYDFATTLKSSGKLIGSCGLNLVSPDEGVIGYCFNRNYWRQGYGTEACKALIGLGFSKLNLHRIYALCDVENVGSAGVMRKSGMRKEGHFLQNARWKGRWRDTFLYAILQDEWKDSAID